MKETVRIGYSAAFWGDTGESAAQLLRVPGLNYLVSDYLAEVTMALLARQQARNPAAGFITDAVEAIVGVAPELKARGIKVVTNAGGLDPVGCAAAVRQRLQALGVELRIAAVQGDSLLGARETMLEPDARDMFTGERLPDAPSTLNAYLGARPIAAALGAGADIVITGRCADSSVVLGPLLHEFGWSDEEYDLLAAGSLIGHVLECGPQCTGGLHTDWRAVPGWDDMGYPFADVRADGTAVIGKPAGTGGLVTEATVAEQILYEIADPGAYVLPDVVCDWRQVVVNQIGPDQVRISGARGSAPTTTYKATATVGGGYRVTATALFSGFEASGRARRAGHAIVGRVARLNEKAGGGPFDEVSVEVIGSGETFGALANEDATEVVLKVGLRHRDKPPLERFAREWASMALVAQGMTGFFAGRPRVSPIHRVLHVLIDKSRVPVSYDLEGSVCPVSIALGDPQASICTPTLEDVAAAPAGTRPGLAIPLRRLAYARSGDKGDNVNIGIIARRPEFLDVIRQQVTCDRVARFFAHYSPTSVRRWELCGLHALNYVLEGVLGGTGGTSTLRYDSQGKSYGAMLLTLPIVIPGGWDLP